MNKDQQQFGARGGDLRTLLLVILAILLSEVFLRSAENSLSGNIAHINEISSLVTDYRPEPGPSFVFLGNSLTNYGVDLPLLDQLIEERGVQIGDSTKLVPDSTTIWSWSCVIENQFFKNNIDPGTVILGFGWNQLSDQSRILPTRLGAFFCSAGDLWTIRKHTDLTSAEAGEFLTAKSLRTYAHRETVRNRVLSALVPNYQSTTQSINRRQRDRQDDAELEFTYSVLDSLIDSLEATNSRLVVVAMPVRDNPYTVDRALVQLLESRNVPLLDYTNLEQIAYGSFLDDMHLSPQGSAVLSTRLAKDLSTIFSTPDDLLRHR